MTGADIFHGMDDKLRCQSCGMPLGEFKDASGQTVNNFATNADDTGELRMPEAKARELAKNVIPKLRRWSVKA